MNEESVFAAAVEKANTIERQAYLDDVCRGDASLRQRVERLLAAHERVQGILDGGLDAAAMVVPPVQPPLPIGSSTNGSSFGRSSARGAWARSGWPTRSNRCNGESPSS